MSQFRKIILFVFQFATIGLAAAFVILILNPEMIQNFRPKVEIKQNISTPPAEPVSTATAAPFSYASAVKQAAPAVVSIFTAKVIQRKPTAEDLLQHLLNGTNPDDLSSVETNLGSGVIMTSQGHIITNNHVITGASEIQVMLSDGRSAEARVVGSDPETDLAILQIKMDRLPSITVGDSSSLQVGDVVLAIGNPYGVGQTVTQGIVSATGRKRLGLNTFENFIQTDAAINPGNSGGSLINPRGELVGINSAIFSRSGGSQGIGFAIPINLARDVMTQIIERGHVVRGWLGIRLRNIPQELADSLGLPVASGVVITGLFEDSPALTSGLQPGDIILSINNQKIFDVRSTLDQVARQMPGTTVKINGLRDGKAFEADVVVAQRPVMTMTNIKR